MSNLDFHAGTPNSLSPTDAWLTVSDDLLWAINHALSNRLAALSSITRILEHSDTGLDPLLSVLAQEITRLERTVELLRLLPRNADEQREPIRITDLLPDVLELHRLQSELREVGYEVEEAPDVLPIWVEPSVLAHALLLLLSAASRFARRQNHAVGIRVSGDADWVTLVIESPAGGAANPVPAEEPAGEWKPVDARAVELLLHAAGAELIEPDFAGDPEHGVRFSLRFPTLPAARRREAQQT